MKKTKRFLALALSCVMLTSAMYGCSDSTDEDSSASGTSQNNSSDDPVMLKWIQISSVPQDLQDVVDEMNAYSIDKIGIGIDLTVLDWGDWETGTNNMLNTGEYFDIMFTNTKHYVSHASKFYDISEIIDTAAPDLKASIPDDVWSGVEIGGKVLGVPTYKDSSNTSYLAWSKESVEKYDIDYQNINSYEEWGDALRKLKEAKEAETGETVYPLQLIGSGADAVGEITMYYDNYVRYDDETATVSNYWESDEVVEKLTYLHEWYEEELINPDASTLAEASNIRDCFIGQAFVGAEANWSQQYGHEYVINEFSPSIMSTDTILGSVNAISANSDYPEEALKYLELLNTDTTLRDMFAYGLEGVHFEYTDGGNVDKLTDTWTLATYSQATYFCLTPVAPNSADQWDKVREQTENAERHVLLGFTLDESSISTELANVNAIWERERGEVMTGAYKGTTEEKLQKLNDDLYAAGLQTVLDETQAQINEFLNK